MLTLILDARNTIHNQVVIAVSNQSKLQQLLDNKVSYNYSFDILGCLLLETPAVSSENSYCLLLRAFVNKEV